MNATKARYFHQTIANMPSENTPSGFVLRYLVAQFDSDSDNAETGRAEISVYFNNNAIRPRAVVNFSCGKFDSDAAIRDFEN